MSSAARDRLTSSANWQGSWSRCALFSGSQRPIPSATAGLVRGRAPCGMRSVLEQWHYPMPGAFRVALIGWADLPVASTSGCAFLPRLISWGEL